MDGEKLLPYRKQLVQILQLTLRLRCKQGYSLACNLLHHILRSTALTYPTDYCSVPGGFNRPLNQYLPIKVRQMLMYFLNGSPLPLFSAEEHFIHQMLKHSLCSHNWTEDDVTHSSYTRLCRTGVVQVTYGTYRSSGMCPALRRQRLCSTYWTSCFSQNCSGYRDMPRASRT